MATALADRTPRSRHRSVLDGVLRGSAFRARGDARSGPLVYLDKWSVYGVARYKEVHAVLNDPATFCSSRGVGLSDFSKEKPWRPPSLILEADPPAHTQDARGAQPGAVAGGHEADPRSLRHGGRRPRSMN